MKYLIILAWLTIDVSHAIGQSAAKIDSLKKILSETTVIDNQTVINYLSIGLTFGWDNPDSSIVYYNKAYLLSQKLNFKEGLLRSQLVRSQVFAIIRFDSAAVSAAYEGIELTDSKDLNHFKSWAYFALGSVYMYLEDFDKGLYYHRESYRREKEPERNPSYYYIPQHMAQCFIGLNRPDSALYYNKRALQLNTQPIDRAWNLYQMGRIYHQLEKYDSSLMFYQKAMQLEIKYDKLFFKKNTSDINIGIAKAFNKLNQKDSAITYVKRALQASSSIGLANQKLQALELLTQLFESKSVIDSAFKYLKLSNLLIDQLSNANKVRQVQLIAFNQTLQDQEIEKIETKRIAQTIIWSLAGALLFTLALASLIYRNNKQRKRAFDLLQRQKQETDLQKLKVEEALSNLKSTQTQLIQSEKMASLGELTAGIAHEIQNPLNFVNNFSDVNTELIDELEQEVNKGNLEEVKLLTKDIKENEQKISHHGKRAGDIVKGMLQHSRSSSGTKEPTDINALCDEYLRLAYHGLRAKDMSFNATVKTEFDETIGVVNIIPQDIGRVILNLINNAFYAVNERLRQAQPDNSYEPTVTVKTKREGDKVLISVKDNGNGIPDSIKGKIFQPFFTTKPTGQGTGLGLSLSYDIVKAHGGELKVVTKEGEGSEFIIQLSIV